MATCLAFQKHFDATNLAEALKGVQGKVNILHTLEGGIYCDEHYDNSVDFFQYIHNSCDKANINPADVTVLWGNSNSKEIYNVWCEQKGYLPQLNFRKVHTWNALLHTNTTDASHIYQTNLMNNDILPKFFTLFSGFPKTHRVKALNFMYENDRLDDIEWTYISTHTSGHNTGEEWRLHPGLHNHIPKSMEGRQPYTDVGPGYLQGHTNPGEEFFQAYKNTYFDLTTESFYANCTELAEGYDWWNTIFLTEKVFRSFYNKRPFVLIGNRYTLAELHKLGFKTFPHIFDESYDELPDEKRLDSILKQVNTIDKIELHSKVFCRETDEILEHNKEVALDYANSCNTLLHQAESGGDNLMEKTHEGRDL